MNSSSSSDLVRSDTNASEAAILGGSFQDFTMSSHDSRAGGNFSDSPGNRTSTRPDEDVLGGHAVWQIFIIVFLTGSLSLVTVVGNVLVLVSFKVNKALKTVNNYYLLSLAFADLTIGTLSMNLYTTYIILDQWTLGPAVCDLWLTVDYVASNASVMNLLVISFDRYFSVTRPLTYRAKRTTKRAMIMIGLAWSVSFVLWAPAILFWQYIVGERTVQPNQCYIQFLSEPIITFCTAIAAFYLPVTIMAVLFWKIYQETEKRAKDVQGLKGSGSGISANQGTGEGSSKKSSSSSRLRQMSLQSSSSCESNRPKKKNKENHRGVTLCFQFSSLLPGHRASARSDDTDATAASDESVCREGEQKSGEAKDERAPSSSSSPAAITMKDAAVAKRFALKARAEINKRKNERKANEKKAARTLSAILLAFIATWLPYNIMVLVNAFCQDCIPETLWALGYWLCYVNSTVNPMCYALCNKTFRTTFRDVLLCRWNQRKKKAANVQEKKAAAAFRKKELT